LTTSQRFIGNGIVTVWAGWPGTKKTRAGDGFRLSPESFKAGAQLLVMSRIVRVGPPLVGATAGVEPAPHTQLKFQYSLQRTAGPAPAWNNIFALQSTVRF